MMKNAKGEVIWFVVDENDNNIFPGAVLITLPDDKSRVSLSAWRLVSIQNPK